MPPRRIHPPPSTPELRPAQIAVLLMPMHVPDAVLSDAQRKSDEAMRMALASGVPINAAYKFLNSTHKQK